MQLFISQHTVAAPSCSITRFAKAPNFDEQSQLALTNTLPFLVIGPHNKSRPVFATSVLSV